MNDHDLKFSIENDYDYTYFLGCPQLQPIKPKLYSVEPSDKDKGVQNDQYEIVNDNPEEDLWGLGEIPGELEEDEYEYDHRPDARDLNSDTSTKPAMTASSSSNEWHFMAKHVSSVGARATNLSTEALSPQSNDFTPTSSAVKREPLETNGSISFAAPLAGELPPVRRGSPHSALSNGDAGPIVLPSIQEQLGDISHIPEPVPGNSPFGQSPPRRPPPQFAAVPGHGSPLKSPNKFRKELPSPGRGAFYNFGSPGPGDYSSSNTETPSTDQSGATPPSIDRMSIDGIGGFQCTHPGCTAQPFQTQYLLNAHANVHSSNRPHYCSVKGCPRSEGGKGFKRKNQTIRHGLVHDDPEYLCPFCPDREHKHRGNTLAWLERHVRVHHVDKSKDDPLVAKVLSWKPDRRSRVHRHTGRVSKQEKEHDLDTSVVSAAKSPQMLGNGDIKISSSDFLPVPVSTEATGMYKYNISDTEGYGDEPLGVEPELSKAFLTSKLDRVYLPLSQIVDSDHHETEDNTFHGSLEKCNTEMPCPSTIATDSGYASMGGIPDPNKNDDQDDNRTVCTDNQELDVPENVKEKLATAFSCELIRNLQTTILEERANKTNMRKSIGEILREFSIRCRRGACAGQQRDATTFVRHYRRRIANLIENSMKSSSEQREQSCEEKEEESEEQGENYERRGGNMTPQEGLSLAEKMHLLWVAPRLEVNSLHIENSAPDFNAEKLEDENEDESEEGNDDYAISHYPDAWKFLTNGEDYQWLLGRVKSEMLLTEREGTAAEYIRCEILKKLASSKVGPGYSHGISKARFEIRWNLLTFLKEHYPDEEHLELASIITIVGDGIDAQALTCGQYMQLVWPTSGVETLSVLQKAVEGGSGTCLKHVTKDKTRINLELYESSIGAVVFGTEPAIAEIGQQLAWLGAALRPAPSGDKMAYSTPKVTSTSGSVVTFKLSFRTNDIESIPRGAEPNGSCWRPLFHNPVIVQGYPIRARLGEERGLEIPLNMMAGLGQASRVVEFDGGLVMKGHSTLFCPTRRVQNSLLWHYVFNEPGERISYLSADTFAGGRLSMDECGTACLERSRHFLGWSSSVEVLAGTKDVKYEEIGWAGSRLAPPGIGLEKFSIVAGQFVTGGASFVRGTQDTSIYISRTIGPYQQTLHFAGNMHVVLYDVGDRRGWLVDGATALLHITRTQLSSSPYSESDIFNIEDFHYADPVAGLHAARRALLDPRNRKMKIFDDWTYQELVEQNYHILERIHDTQTKILSSPVFGLRFTDREKLVGYGFMDIVTGQNDLRPRVATLKASGRGWVDFTRKITAITLLAKGLGDLIRPSRTSNRLCKQWSQVPKGKDYLVAGTAMLKKVALKHGDCDSDPLDLADGIYWHKPDKLYEPCHCKHNGGRQTCDRIQVLFPPSLGRKTHPDPFNCIDGAVIFGRSKKFSLRWPSRGSPDEVEPSESDSDSDSHFQDSGIGESHPSTSDLESSGNMESSPSNGSQSNSVSHEESTMSGGLGEDDQAWPLSQMPDQDYVIPARPRETDQISNEVLPGIDSSNAEIRQKDLAEARRGKRAWDKMKEIAPQIFPRKRQKANYSGFELEVTDNPAPNEGSTT